MEKEIQKVENSIVTKTENSIVPMQNQDISEIVSNQEMKDVLSIIFKECDEHRSEALEAYFLFKDSVLNGGEFDSSGVSKEQMNLLLQTAQSAVDSKIRIFDALLRVKAKKDITIQTDELNQTNVYVSNRRELLEAIEQSKNEIGLKNILKQDEEIKIEAEKLNTEIIDIKIEAGEF
jgi:hypothetical protein